MSTNGPLVTDPNQATRDAFRQAAKSNDFAMTKSRHATSKRVLTPKDLGFALLQGTQMSNTAMVAYSLTACGDQISVEDRLTAYEIATLINNPETITHFSNHFSKGKSPRTANDKKDHIDTLNALKIANGDLAILQDPNLSAFSARKALWVTGEAGNVERFATILKSAKITAQDKGIALTKAVKAGQAKIVNLLLETSKADITPIDLGLALEAATQNSDFPTIRMLYQHCKATIPLNSIGMALEKIIDNERYNPTILTFILKESGPKIEGKFIATALQAAVWRNKVDAVEQLLPLKNTGPEQRKQALIAAISAKKQEFFYNARFSLMDRIRASGGISSYLLKLSQDFEVARPRSAFVASVIGRLISAFSKAWDNEPATPLTKAESLSTQITSPVSEKSAPTLVFSGAAAAAVVEKNLGARVVTAPKPKKSVGFKV